jgi:hypothetical protein
MAGIAIENLRRLAARASLDIEFVVLPLETDEAALINYRVDLFLGIADVNGPHHRSSTLPVGFRIEHVAIGPAVREGTAPKDSTALRIGARTPEVARKEGYTAAQVRTGDIVKELAPALASGELDVLIGGREGLVFALMLQGKDPTTLRAQTVTLERRDLTFRLLPEAEAKWGTRLRAAATEFDWDRSYRQLRQRFLNPELVRSLRLPSNCPDAPLGTGQR